MMLYSLYCAKGHDFESWFRDSAAFDDQKTRGLVVCPVCGSRDVKKAIMAPALGAGTRKSAAPEPVSVSAPVPASGGAVLMGEKEQAVRAMLKAVREHVMQNADYVGDNFAEKARLMHEGAEEQRAIYGEASPEEVRALLEDEIEVLPLPSLPDDRN